MMEIQIVPVEVKHLDWNIEELKAELNKELEPYRNPVELEKRPAKEIVAFLNKLIKAMNDRAIAIDKELSQPIKDFRTEVKELNAMVEDVQKPYKEFIDKLEAERVQERIILIHELYEDIFKDYKSVIPEEQIFRIPNKELKDDGIHKEWLNATTKPENIAGDMNATIINLEEGLAALDRMNLPFDLFAQEAFLRTSSTKEAINASKRAEAVAKFFGAEEEEDDGFPYDKKAEIVATDSQYRKLEDFCRKNGIEIKWL